MRKLLTFIGTLAAAYGSANTALAQRVGDACVVSASLKATSKPGGRGKRATIRKGTGIIVAASSKGWLRVETDRAEYWVKKSSLKRVCGAGKQSKKGRGGSKKRAGDGAKSTAPGNSDESANGSPDTTDGTNDLQLAPVPTSKPTGDPGLEALPPPAPEDRPAQPRVVGRLVVQVDALGAEILVDGKRIGYGPSASAALSAGEHLVQIKRSGKGDWEQLVSISADDETVIDANLGGTTRARRSDGGGSLGWASLGVGGAGVLAATTLFFLGKSKASDLATDIDAYNKGQHQPTNTFNELEQRRSSVGTLDSLAVMTALVGAGGLGMSGYLYITGQGFSTGRRRRRGAVDSDTLPSSTPTVAVTLGPDGIAMGGTF